MAILNYTTVISANKTIGEIMEILTQNGAKKVMIDNSNDQIPMAVTFALTVQNNLMYFTLPADYEGMLAAMVRDKKIPRKFCTKDQSIRVAWRVIKDWIAAQCTIVQAGLVEMAEVFLPYAITKSGNTLYKEMKHGNQLLLKK